MQHQNIRVPISGHCDITLSHPQRQIVAIEQILQSVGLNHHYQRRDNDILEIKRIRGVEVIASKRTATHREHIVFDAIEILKNT